MNKRPDAVLIAGPTASGKTSAALELAEALDGEIINADSMQVYPVLQNWIGCPITFTGMLRWISPIPLPIG